MSLYFSTILFIIAGSGGIFACMVYYLSNFLAWSEVELMVSGNVLNSEDECCRFHSSLRQHHFATGYSMSGVDRPGTLQ